VTVLHARADLSDKQVFYHTNTVQHRCIFVLVSRDIWTVFAAACIGYVNKQITPK